MVSLSSSTTSRHRRLHFDPLRGSGLSTHKTFHFWPLLGLSTLPTHFSSTQSAYTSSMDVFFSLWMTAMQDND